MSIGDLANATLQRIYSPGAPTTGGDAGQAVVGPEINVPCIIDEPSFLVRRLIDESQLNADAVLYVDPADFPAAFQQLVIGASVQVAEQNSPTIMTMRIEQSRQMSGSMPFVRCLVRRP